MSKILTEEEYNKVKHLLEVESSKYTKINELVGRNVFIRTLTMYYTGHIEAIDGKFISLSTAAWIADTGRFADFIKGEPKSNLEVEPMGDVFVNLDSVVDISKLHMELPTEQI